MWEVEEDRSKTGWLGVLEAVQLNLLRVGAVLCPLWGGS